MRFNLKLFRLLLFISVITVVSCKRNGHYEIYNQIPAPVDISELINTEKYSLDSCDKRAKRLIRTEPYKFSEANEQDLQFKLRKWVKTYNDWLKQNHKDTIHVVIDNLYEKTSYQYSYLITDKPVDVYRTDTKLSINGNANFTFYIRLDDNNEIYNDFNEINWIDTKCDTINSKYQEIYQVEEDI